MTGRRGGTLPRVPHPLHVVDVFAESRWAGNPLAVVLGAASLSGDEMQAIARETNLSETTFVTGRGADGGFAVRIFTPAQELPFAGHPTLGTAWVLRHHVAEGAPPEVTLSLGVGPVRVRFEDDVPWLEAPPVTLGATFPAERVAPVLSLDPGDLHAEAPARHMAAGIQFLFVPLRSLDALRRMRLDAEAMAPLAEETGGVGVYAFCTQTREPASDVAVRLQFLANGVREDPATGSACAMLGAYLLEHPLLGAGPLALRVEQGHEIQRPSHLSLRARRAGEGRILEVGGRVLPAVTGTLL